VLFYSLSETTAIVDGTQPDPGLVGTGMVTAAQAATWVGLVNGGHKIVVNLVSISSAEPTVYSVPNTQSGGLVARSSSWGLPQELDIKPQFAAPGQSIVSTWLQSGGGSYRVDSGTSMVSPFVAAAYALLAEARGTHDPGPPG